MKGLVDPYSMMIVCKYFTNVKDFQRVEMVCSKYRNTMEKFHFNPTVLTEDNRQFFPNVETQYIYGNEQRLTGGRIVKYEHWNEITEEQYNEFIEYNRENGIDNILYKKIKKYREEENQHQPGMMMGGFGMQRRGGFGNRGRGGFGMPFGGVPFGVPMMNNFNNNFNNNNDDDDNEDDDNDNNNDNTMEEEKHDPTTIIDYGYYADKDDTDIVIPDSITSIRNGICINCKQLTSITLSGMISILPKASFKNCHSLKEIVIPSSVDTIDDECFMNCVKLSSINIPSFLLKLGKHAFTNCSSLTTIELPSILTCLDDGCFVNCKSIENEFTIPSQLYHYGKRVFNGCASIKKLHILKPLEIVESYEFSGMNSLISIELPTTVTRFEHHAFKDCHVLEEFINISLDSIEIEDKCFDGCNIINEMFSK